MESEQLWMAALSGLVVGTILGVGLCGLLGASKREPEPIEDEDEDEIDWDIRRLA